MYYQTNICCLCLGNQIEIFHHLSDSGCGNVKYYEKINTELSEQFIKNEYDSYLLCQKCCSTIDFVYEFRNRCIRNLSTFNLTVLNSLNNKHCELDAELSDISNNLIDNKCTKLEPTDSMLHSNRELEYSIDNRRNNELTCEKDPLNDTDNITDYLTEYLNKEDKSLIIDNSQIISDNISRNLATSSCNSRQIEHVDVSNMSDNIGKLNQIFKKEFNHSLGLHSEFIKIEETETNKQISNELTYEEQISFDVTNTPDNVVIKTEYTCIKNEQSDINADFINEDENFISVDSSPVLTSNTNQDVSREIYNSQHIEMLHVSEQVGEAEDNEKSKLRCLLTNQGHTSNNNYGGYNKEFTKPKSEDISDKGFSQAVEKSYNCDVCNKDLPSPSKLATHRLIHTGEKPYKCDVCNKGFTTLSNLKAHKIIHTGQKPHNCDICNKGFASLSNFKRHKRTHTGEKPYKCDVCNRKYTHLRLLKRHKLTHTGDKSYKCDICNKEFTQSCDLARHKLTHTGAKPFKCNVCNKGFTQSGDLSRHKLIHKGEKSFKCDVCGKKFAQSGYLAAHKVVHTREKSYKCDICNKGFTSTSSLTVHTLLHTGENMCDATHKLTYVREKPYSCDVCNKGFTSTSSLTVHRLVHTGEKPFECEVCNKRFTQSSSLTVHKLVHTGEKPHMCDVCNKGFSSPSKLVEHRLVHTGDKPYKCHVCNKRFKHASSLKTHNVTHTGERPFNCDLCNKGFATSSNFRRHKRIHLGVKRSYKSSNSNHRTS